MSQYEIIWTEPSDNSMGSMPLGNGDIALNVWVEPSGDLVLYIAKGDAWSSNGRLLKIGRVRAKCGPSPLDTQRGFTQLLRLKSGEIEITGGEGAARRTLRVWVDANRPVVRIEASGAADLTLSAEVEIWRTADRELVGDELNSAYGQGGGPVPVVETADTLCPPNNQLGVIWFHRNTSSIWRQTIEHQGLSDWLTRPEASDPLIDRTFGGAITGVDFVHDTESSIRSKSGKTHLLSIHLLTAQTATPEGWFEKLSAQIKQTDSVDLEASRTSHRKWWGEFWDRSWIHASGTPQAEAVSRGYALQRFVAACAGRGAFPIKFNGSLFTVDSTYNGRKYDADFRLWGECYWAQNTRLPYWAMLAAGDFDLMRPLFRMYVDALALAKFRTRQYFNHGGAFYPEVIHFWGAYANSNYGWDRAGVPPSLCRNAYIRYHWQGGIELVAMMLDYFRATSDEPFFRSTLLPLADEVLRFYDEHYARGADGKLRIEPAQALETWHEAINPMPEVAGLRCISQRLLTLPSSLLKEESRRRYQRLNDALPDIPMRAEGLLPAKSLAPAAVYKNKANTENPELYAIFPYRIYGVGKPDLELARLTFARRENKGSGGWRQDAIQAALLGLTDEAKRDVVQNFSSKNPDCRFPAFWGPNFDWTPDQDHGSVAMMALQSMLLQTAGDDILLFPAWPREWDVDFRLHAPGNTVVEARLHGGKVERIDVAPPQRSGHVRNLLGG